MSIEEKGKMKITLDFNKTNGKIKAMHGIGQPPLMGINTKYFKYLDDAVIPYSRLHDVDGRYGGGRYVDIPNIFRNFDADETKEESYDFAFTDFLLKALLDNGCEPYFRLGVSIENQHNIRAYHIYPPKDFAKWARICEHIIRHYNEGWANGFHYNIEYWEIWNEPDNGPTLETNNLWLGTKEEFYELYTVTSKHLKACFGDKIKVGGYGSSGVGMALSDPEKYGLSCPAFVKNNDVYMTERGAYFIEFFEGFLEYISKNNAPLDFFPWHSYGLKTLQIGHCVEYVDKMLAKYGYEKTENHLNEWSVSPTGRSRGTVYAAARCAATMLNMQNKSTEILCIYDGQITIHEYGALFCPYPEVKPFPLYFSLKAFGELYKLGDCVKPEFEESEYIFAQAAINGDKKAFMITNIAEEEQKIETNLGSDMKAYIIDADHELDLVEIDPTSFVMKPDDVILFRNY